MRVDRAAVVLVMSTVISFSQSTNTRTTRPAAKTTAAAKAPTVAAPTSALTISSLKTDGLRNRDAITALYTGNFADVKRPILQRLNYYGFYVAFLEEYAHTCADQLPANKVPLTTYSCALEKQPVDGYGRPVAQKYCAQEYRQPIPGEFAYPDDEKTQVQLEHEGKLQAIHDTLADKDHPFDWVKDSLMEGNYAAADWKVLFAVNGCANPAVNRLRTNMGYFAREDYPLHLDDKERSPYYEESKALYSSASYCEMGHNSYSNHINANDRRRYVLPDACYNKFKQYLDLYPDGDNVRQVKQTLEETRPESCEESPCRQ